MGLTAEALLGLRVGVLTEATRTRELRRVFRQRLRAAFAAAVVSR